MIKPGPRRGIGNLITVFDNEGRAVFLLVQKAVNIYFPLYDNTLSYNRKNYLSNQLIPNLMNVI